MKAKAVLFDSRPSDVSISQATRVGFNGRGQQIQEAVPLEMGGSRLSCKFSGAASIELGDLFMEFNILWRVIGYYFSEEGLEVHAISVCSLADLVELIPVF